MFNNEKFSQLAGAVRETHEFNLSLAAIPAEGVIPEVRASYLYLPAYLLDFLGTEKVSYFMNNMRQIREVVERKKNITTKAS